MPVSPSRNPRYAWSIILIIVLVSVLAMIYAYIRQSTLPPPRPDTGHILVPPSNPSAANPSSNSATS